MSDEPARHQQADRQNNGQDGQPVLARPPQGQEKAHTEDDAGDLARNDVKPREDQKGTNDGGSQITSGESDSTDPTLHMGDTAFMGIKRDGLDFSTCAARGDRMAELMERNDQHLLN